MGEDELRLKAALREAPEGAALVAISFAAPTGSEAALLGALPGQPACAVVPPGEGFVGLGSSASLRLDCHDAAAAVGWAEARFCSLHVAAGAAPPRMFAGAAFSPRSLSAPWRAFPALELRLPRWTYLASGTALTLVAERTALRQPRPILHELETLRWALGRSVAPLKGQRLALSQLSEARWARLVGDALNSERTGAHKIVCARQATAQAARPLRPERVFAALLTAPDSTAFAIQSGSATFLGATPELLVRKVGREVYTRALAGTLPAGARAGAKLTREQGSVVADLRERLRPFVRSVRTERARHQRVLQDFAHLETALWGALRRPAHALELALALHPTPAVGGAPREAAVRFIEEREPAARGWYTGFVGAFDAHGDGELWVSIRCGLLQGRRAYLYTGAGVVDGSLAVDEYAETALKQRPFLRALGGFA